MSKNARIVLDYLISKHKEHPDNTVFEETDIINNTRLNYDDYIAAIHELKFLGYIQKWIVGIKLEVD